MNATDEIGVQNDGWDTDHRYPNADVQWYADIADVEHGVNGHSGFRCLECARISGRMNSIEADSGDYWQNQQISWQEDCDNLIVAFNEEVADHFPVHTPFGKCISCPVAPQMPPKPNPPIERRRY